MSLLLYLKKIKWQEDYYYNYLL